VANEWNYFLRTGDGGGIVVDIKSDKLIGSALGRR
jgi:hypothetical protein